MPFAKFPGRFEQLAKIRQFVSDAARDAKLSDKDTHAVEQAVDEACSNIIEHAYGGRTGDIICTCCTIDSGIKITLQDNGNPFHPEDIADPDLSRGLMEVQTGGLGLYFIRKLMDEVKFDFTPDRGNILTLVKNRGKST